MVCAHSLILIPTKQLVLVIAAMLLVSQYAIAMMDIMELAAQFRIEIW